MNVTNEKETPLLLSEYLQLTTHYKNIYGTNTVLIMQVGAFFEIYGLKNVQTGEIQGSSIVDVCQICQLNISEKKICVGDNQVLMAGFRDYTLDKYIQKITEGSYTLIVYVQDKNGKTITRKLHSIHSPGTYISYETDSSIQITNNIMCIWFELVKPLHSGSRETLIYGLSVANIFTGKSFLFEYETSFYMNPTTFDELERSISVFSPSEIIILSPFDNSTLNTIIQYSGIKSNVIHKLNTKIQSKDNTNLKIENCGKQKYIQHILSTFFGQESYQICSEFNTYQMATQSFCYLLDFIQEHNPNLVRKIQIPSFNNNSNRLILANHTLKQLNILDDTGKAYGTLSSVLSFMNKSCTPMGKRLLQYQLTNPTFDEKWLTMEYNTISILLNQYHFIEFFRKQLGLIRDLEKICRQLVLRKLYPSSIYHLYNSINIIQQINVCLIENPELCEYLLENIHSSPNKYINDVCIGIVEFIQQNLHIDTCKNISSIHSFDENIIKSGISQKLDELISKQNENLLIFVGIQDYFNKLLQNNEKDKDKSETEYVKKHETEKSGISLQLTKKRSSLLKTILTSMDQQYEVNIRNATFKIKDVKMNSVSTNSDEIHFYLLSSVTQQIYKSTEDINNEIIIAYENFLTNLENKWFHQIEILSKYISKMDVLQSKTYIAQTYNYCKPEIKECDKSYVVTEGLRHCLIEHLQQNELYVTNDIEIGNDKRTGMLLYGTNAVGKTSFIRALGISVILAQSGMYVPCSKFIYKPYTAIYSRILGNDNLFKGLSTFAVEMSELRIILKMADKNSLILGDEVCSGTETESALSIFVTALMDLHEKQSSFIFATHFHEIIQYNEIKNLTKMDLCHMSVIYDREKDCLLYDRKLKNGPGNRMYGLEVCKSLYLEEEFLTKAYSIRNKYFPENRGELSHNTSVYNAKKIRGLCEICKNEIAEETHHLIPQKDASEIGYINTFHKNHPANLISVWEPCHDNFHTKNTNTEDVKKIVKKKTTKGYILNN